MERVTAAAAAACELLQKTGQTVRLENLVIH